MPLRYGKTACKQLREHAMRRLMLPPSRLDKTMPALMRKAVRQMQRQMLSKVEQKVVEVTVVAVLPAYRQVRVKTVDGDQYAVTETTPGLRWDSLQEGQRLTCTVTTSSLPRVLKVLSKKEGAAYSAEEPSHPTLEHMLEERMRNANIGPNSR